MVAATTPNSVKSNRDRTEPDVLAWDIYNCWKEQLSDRFGGGTRAPSIPRSQRQYDGDDYFGD